MGRVKVLDKNLANMIAAGEVVERPASVVKELVENSIDSMADSITIEVKNGGKTYIRVTDNGFGMTMEDARTAFKRHATSKISNEGDLFNIGTMGFRGEALAAISAVSKVELMTATTVSQYGASVIIEGGEEKVCSEVGLPVGTTVIVRDLFYNTPARMNFMKKDATENANIVSLVNRFAIGNPQISFKLITDSRTVLSTDSGLELADTVYAVLGKEISDSLIPAERVGDEVCVSGLVGSPRASRSNRNYQLFYVNRRIVKSKTITAAVDRAYHNLLMNGKYAVCVLMLNLPFDRVDVNVHPTKTEVKFSDEKAVFDAVYYAVRDALEREPQINRSVEAFFRQAEAAETGDEHFKFDFTEPENHTRNETSGAVQQVMTLPHDDKVPIDAPPPAFSGSPFVLSKKDIRDSGFFTRKTTLEIDELSEKFSPEKLDDSYMLKPEVPYRYVGEVFKTYIIVESGSSFYLIDKHAAHERILFDKIYDKYKNSERYCQQLLTAVPVTLSPEEAAAARENKEKIEMLGYEFDEFGEQDVIIRSVPYVISPGDTVSGFIETLELLTDGKNLDMTEFENRTLKLYACKAAIKAGFDSSDWELQEFIKKMLTEGIENYCPHGRPIICEYTKASVEKLFKRIV